MYLCLASSLHCIVAKEGRLPEGLLVYIVQPLLLCLSLLRTAFIARKVIFACCCGHSSRLFVIAHSVQCPSLAAVGLVHLFQVL